MANNSFIDPIERGGVRPNSGSFERRDDYKINSVNPASGVNHTPFGSIDGRNWSTRDQALTANKEYYQKLYDKPKGFMNNVNR